MMPSKGILPTFSTSSLPCFAVPFGTQFRGDMTLKEAVSGSSSQIQLSHWNDSQMRQRWQGALKNGHVTCPHSQSKVCTGHVLCAKLQQ